MKKITKIFCVSMFLLFALCSLLSAGNPITLLNAVTSTGPGTANTLGGSGIWEGYKDWTCQANITGAPTAVTVRLEGNLTGSTFSTIAEYIFTAAELTATQAVFSATSMPANQIRGNLITLTGGTAPTVTFQCVGVK